MSPRIHKGATFKTVIVSEPNVIRKLQATASVSSLTVTWDEPSPGLVERYTVELRGETEPKQEINVKSATFNSLTPGKQYTVVVVAFSGNLSSGGQKSAETVGHFYTSKSDNGPDFANSGNRPNLTMSDLLYILYACI